LGRWKKGSEKMERNYIPFTKEMKKEYTILAPNMLPIHFKLILKVLKNDGYKIDLLETQGSQIAETGLKYVHNDTCYPAILVIGQFIEAIKSGKYDPHKVALILFQTGGGCRASNYIFLLRKALAKAGYEYVPVISFSLAGLENHPGFRLTLPILHRMFYAILYADLLLLLVNQCKPYEIHKGESEALADAYTRKLADEMDSDGVSFRKAKEHCREMLKDFGAIPVRAENKIRVGIVGEIYVKYSPLGNNNLEQFLVDQGAEVTIPGLLDFCLYCVYNQIMDYRLYHRGVFIYPAVKWVYGFLTKKQQEFIDIIREDGRFRPFNPFPHTVELIRSYIGLGCKMGEGWLLPAEMIELADSGVKNIVCTQPFGCLPNHICGKGMMKPIKDRNPDINIVAVDYDASATKVNQENRIKLMLSNALEAQNSK
jgi:predicted nucleotide-binding protein (sugar kinase/HSP70/actin superfamily)